MLLTLRRASDDSVNRELQRNSIVEEQDGLQKTAFHVPVFGRWHKRQRSVEGVHCCVPFCLQQVSAAAASGRIPASAQQNRKQTKSGIDAMFFLVLDNTQLPLAAQDRHCAPRSLI